MVRAWLCSGWLGAEGSGGWGRLGLVVMLGP